MPLFEFKCGECGTEFEELLFRRDEADEVSCPSCGSDTVEKLLSSFAAPGKSEGPAATGKTCVSKSPFS